MTATVVPPQERNWPSKPEVPAPPEPSHPGDDLLPPGRHQHNDLLNRIVDLEARLTNAEGEIRVLRAEKGLTDRQKEELTAFHNKQNVLHPDHGKP